MPIDEWEMKYIVRKAVAADAAELARLRWKFRVENQPGQAHAEFVRDCEVWLLEALASGQWVVAVGESETGKLIGTIYLQCVEKVPVPGKIERAWGYVTNSYVVSEWRGHGVGRKLFELLIDAGRARGLEFLIVWPSKEAVSFYDRAGFLPVSVVHVGPDDEPPLELPLCV